MKLTTFSGLGLLAALGTVSPAKAQEKASAPIELGVGVTFTDKYQNLRGFVPDDNPAFQPYANVSVNAGFGTFKAGFWANEAVNGEHVETDVTVSYSRSLSLGLGELNGVLEWANYNVRGSIFQEVNGRLRLKNALNPELMVAGDYREGAGIHSEVSINPVMDFHRAVLSASLAYMHNHHYAREGSGFVGFRGQAELSKTLGPATLTLKARGFAATAEDFKSDYSLASDISFKLEGNP